MRDHHIQRNSNGRRSRTLSSVLALTAATALIFGIAQPAVADDEETTTVQTTEPAAAPSEAGVFDDEDLALQELTAEAETEFHGATTEEEASLGEDAAIDGPFRTARPGNGPRRSIPRCGLRTAVVFDISNSIGDRGLRASKEAGKTVIDILSGTSTTLSIFNFATNAPADPGSEVINAVMAKPEDVDRAKRSLDQMSLPSNRLGGTNWAGALGRLNDAAARDEKYDVVYFITDGKPTAPVGDGVVTNDSDILKAQRAARQLINAGTHIVGVGVGFRPNDRNLVDVHPDPEYGYPPRDRRTAREVTARYRDQGSQAANVSIPGVSKSNERVHGYELEYVRFTTTQLKMLESISLERIILPNGFDHLREELKRAFSGCSAKVVIKKEIVDAAGTVIHNGADITTQGVSPEGFEFNSQLYKTNGGRVEKVEGQKVTTDPRGLATLTVPTVPGNDGLEPGTLEVSEDLRSKPGWEQLLVDGPARKTALCTAKAGDGTPKKVIGQRAPQHPEPGTIYVENSRDTKGFIVRNVQHFDTVECVVKNVLPQADFGLVKEKISEPLALTGEKDQQLRAEYRVKVRNNSAHEATPGDILEAPQNLSGFDVVELRVAGELVKEQNLLLNRDGAGWIVPAAQLNSIRGGAERSMTVSVTYRVSNPERATAEEPKLQCRGDGGLRNRVVIKRHKDNRDKWAEACVDVQPPADGNFEITKKAVHDPVVVTGTKNQELTATYEVAVKNNSSFAATPRDLAETPTALPGMSIIDIRVAGELASNPAGLRKGRDGSWSLGKDSLKKIEAKRTATMRVEVRYRVTDPANTIAAKNRHRCVAGQEDKGLFNTVRMAASKRTGGPAEQKATACVNLATPELKVEKFINGQDASTKEKAYPLAPNTTSVQFTYRFSTGDLPFDVIYLNDEVIEPRNGGFVDINTLRCTGGTFLPGRPGATGDDGPRITVARNHNGLIECHATISDQRALPGSGGHTHTKVVAQGHYTVPDYQATPAHQATPLRGEASGWIFRFPALVGELPRSGGAGHSWYLTLGTTALIFAAAAAWNSIRKLERKK